MARPELANLKAAIKEHGGVISEVADHFRVTRRTVYNWRDEFGLGDYIKQCRAGMREVAEDVMYQVLIADPMGEISEIERKKRLTKKDKFKLSRADTLLDRQLSVAKFTLQNTNQAGQFISVSDETLRLMRLVGLSVEDASNIFEEMVREAARQKQLVA